LVNAVDENLQELIRNGIMEILTTLREAIEQLKNGTAPLKMQLNDWASSDDLVYYKGKLAIPHDDVL